MAKSLWKAARWLVGIGLLIIGARKAPEAASTVEQRWRDVIPWSWLEANWIALACFVLAAVLLLSIPFEWWLKRQWSKDLRTRIRANLAPGTFHEIDGAAALRYLLKESAWAWKQYARLNYWTWVDGLHLVEFERASRAGEIITIGYGSRENAVVVIERRNWVDGRIDERTATVPNAVVMRIDTPSNMRFTYAQLAIAAADLEATWPRASLWQRLWARLWVWCKKRFWYGSKLSNWLDRRRREKKQARTPG